MCDNVSQHWIILIPKEKLTVYTNNLPNQRFPRLTKLLKCLLFFRAQAVEEALRKDRGCPVEKETLKKERRGGKRPTCYAAPSS